MSFEWLAVVMFAGFFLLLITGYPVAFSFAGTALVFGLSLSATGYPLYGSDTGGYRHSPPDKEVFTRWFEQTALSTVMQIGTSSNDVAWEPTPENGFDDEIALFELRAPH